MQTRRTLYATLKYARTSAMTSSSFSYSSTCTSFPRSSALRPWKPSLARPASTCASSRFRSSSVRPEPVCCADGENNDGNSPPDVDGTNEDGAAGWPFPNKGDAEAVGAPFWSLVRPRAPKPAKRANPPPGGTSLDGVLPNSFPAGATGDGAAGDGVAGD